MVKQYFTHSLRSFVKYCFYHLKFISSRRRVISSLYIIILLLLLLFLKKISEAEKSHKAKKADCWGTDSRAHHYSAIARPSPTTLRLFVVWPASQKLLQNFDGNSQANLPGAFKFFWNYQGDSRNQFGLVVEFYELLNR